MPVALNHVIIWCSDAPRSAAFLVDVLGRPPAVPFHRFLVVDLDNGVSLDFLQKDGAVAPQHYAFLVDEAAFDAGFARIQALGARYWADPARSEADRINHHDGGRGVYFDDPDGHLMELITRPYGRA